MDYAEVRTGMDCEVPWQPFHAMPMKTGKGWNERMAAEPWGALLAKTTQLNENEQMVGEEGECSSPNYRATDGEDSTWVVHLSIY